MSMDMTRILIVNADDFGQSSGVNRGIIRAHEHGIVTSASLMVRWPAAVEASVYAKAHSELAVGLHLDLGEWIFRSGEWSPLYQVVDMDDPSAIAGEVSRQLSEFHRLMERNPTHIDSHQHTHRHEPAHSAAAKAAKELGIPLRGFCSSIRYCGEFYGQGAGGALYPQGISVDNLLAILANLQPGVTELGCHPGEAGDLNTMYGSERGDEVKTLCDPRVRKTMCDLGIELASYHRYPITEVDSY